MGDFNNLKLEDVVVNGVPLAEKPAETPDEVPAETPTQTPAETPAVVPDNKPAEDAPVDLSKAEVKFTPPAYKDDFIKGAVEYYEKTGDLTPYLQAKTVDFKGMTDEEIMRRDLREQYPDVSDKAFERLYKQQVVDKFKIDADEFGQEDSELGRELLKVEAEKVRQKKIEWQKSFTAPEPVASQEEKEKQEAIERQLKAFEESVKTSEITKSLLADKRIVIKAGDADFNFELQDPDALVDMTLNNDKFFSLFAGADGKVDYSRWYKAVAYAQNPELFEKSLLNYGRTLGREEVTREIKNPSNPVVGDVPTEGSGDLLTGLLGAFKDRGIHT